MATVKPCGNSMCMAWDGSLKNNCAEDQEYGTVDAQERCHDYEPLDEEEGVDGDSKND